MATAQRVAAVRRFNRFYTRTIGVLGDGIQRSPYSLTEARLIYELSQAERVETADLRARLGLDPGYLSRILARFEADGLVTLGRSETDSRRQTVAMTGNGRRVFAIMDAHAVEDMSTLLERLADTDQRSLLDAMATIQRLWDPPAQPEVNLRPPAPGDLGWVVQRHGALYAHEYGLNDEFEALVSRIVADFVQNRVPEREACWIADVDSVPAGSIFCVSQSEFTAQLRLLFVEPWARGLGVGGRLVGECLSFAASRGYREMVLWTNANLHGARRLYERAGFTLVSEEDSVRFGGPQVFENWRISLANGAPALTHLK